MTNTPTKSEPTQEELAAQQARLAFLQNQALGLMNTARALKCQLLMAVEANELPPALREFLCKELMMCAAVAEVKK